MRQTLVFVSLAAFVALWALGRHKVPSDSLDIAQASVEPGMRQPVLVELFTSEGCSSCPPADALLSRLEREQPIQGAEVIAIEEHVDYWNQQGWIDPFSSPEWTSRQEGYIARFKEGGPYTPEMIVDGQTEFVGSREREAREAIERASQQAKAEIALTAEKSADLLQRVGVRIEKTGKLDSGKATLWLAITEKNLQSAVKAGENAGRDLHHASVLRLLQKVGTVEASSLPFSSVQEVKLKSNWNRENLRIVAFAQDARTWRILGVAAIHLGS